MLSAFFKGSRVKEDLDEFYPLRKDVDVSYASKFRPRGRKRLSAEKWKEAFDAEGRLVGLDDVLEAVRKGGVDPHIRPQVWEFLLGVFDANSTYAERDDLRRARRQIYANLKVECNLVDPVVGSGVVVDFPRVREDGTDIPVPAHTDNPMIEMLDMTGSSAEGVPSLVQTSANLVAVSGVSRGMSFRVGASATAVTSLPRGRSVGETREHVLDRAGQEKVRKWRLGLHQIGVDVMRADRTLQFFEDEGNRARMMDVLALYSWFDSDVGYCQGMGDLMSPMLVLFDDNVDAFWCFERLMRKVRVDFIGTATSLGVQAEIMRLAEYLKMLEPELFLHLDDIGAGSLFFTVRSIMTMFRRELSFADALYLWEMQWAWEHNRAEMEVIATEDRRSIRSASIDPFKASSRQTFLETDEQYAVRKQIENAKESSGRIPLEDGDGGEYDCRITDDRTMSAPFTAAEVNAIREKEQRRLERTLEQTSLDNSSDDCDLLDAVATDSVRSKKLGHNRSNSISHQRVEKSLENSPERELNPEKQLTGGVKWSSPLPLPKELNYTEIPSSAPRNGSSTKTSKMARRFLSMPRASLKKDLVSKALDYNGRTNESHSQALDSKPKATGFRSTIRRRLHPHHRDYRATHADGQSHSHHFSRGFGKGGGGGAGSRLAWKAKAANATVGKERSVGQQGPIVVLDVNEDANGEKSGEPLLGQSATAGSQDHRLTRLNTFCVLSVLIKAKTALMECEGMDDVVDVYNGHAAVFDVKDLCKTAHAQQEKYGRLDL